MSCLALTLGQQQLHIAVSLSSRDKCAHMCIIRIEDYSMLNIALLVRMARSIQVMI